jgi:carbamoyltransferase
MITWGISAASHNAAIAVFDNNQLVFASDSERFSKIKNDPDLCHELIKYARKFGNPELICWYEKPWLKTLRQLISGQGYQDNNVREYLRKFGIRAPIKTFKHHKTHAAAGYYTSGFDNACVLVIDAIGEFECLTQWQAQGNELHKFSSLGYPNSLGLFYSAMTQRCGLKPNEEEYILMGMAALGDPTRLVQDILNEFFDFSKHPYRLKQNLHRGCNWWRAELTNQQDIYDIAAATQTIYETVFEQILKNAAKSSRSKNLVLMGGCALNCAANPIAYKYFDQVWIMPAPGDNGSSIGAVLAHKKTHIEWNGPYLGYDMGYKASNEEIVAHLLEHKMCGIARGPAEFGPRALGNRSLIADPRGSKIKVAINQIKHREQFRPFAPAILEEFANQYFKMPTKSTGYMQYIAPCLESESFPAIVHLDNTSRVQTVNKTDNPQFRALLELWYAKTGCPMLLNTSLNIKGQPMINDAADSAAWTRLHGLPVFN